MRSPLADVGAVHEVHEGVGPGHAADDAEHRQVREVGPLAPHEAALPQRRHPLLRARGQLCPGLALDVVLLF